jgi:SET domain-containing protein
MPCDEVFYLNHSCNPKILDPGLGFDIVVMAAGEEATYDYRTFHDRDDIEFTCLCRAESCCRRVVCVHPPATELREYWDLRLDSAL